ncbi:PAS/PAC sensor hybrid histidine kinase [Labilithrix luteola]|uniref:histidine kinase n=2 Tax=Labilithrix luteola TaxID=1391654 RepID=A0A0K1Q462_9BACT|nr:PAS/PAC sensor hybrid histidine kinase [Labilithrix luteola]
MEERNKSSVATVLVVDDNDANRALARDTLEDEGYRVVLASGGNEGIAAFEREPPDCIVLDVRMPEVDGFAVCERIRAMPRGAETPILFLTALRDVDTFDRALGAGGDDFLTKPVRPTELVVRVQTAIKLRRMSEELREHYDLLKRQRDDLLRLQLQKERLTAFVVHDLKNPVNAMDLHAQLLLRDQTLSASSRESAGRIRVEARQLNRMIVNLLDISKADEGKLAPKRTPVDLVVLLRETAAEFAAEAERRKVSLDIAPEPASVAADEELLRRVLANLIENAIRHTPAESSVTIRAAAKGANVEIRIADAGAGVPPEMREKIFDAFVQIELPEEQKGARASRGLGLTFCKLAIAAHGGTIAVEDAAPGAVFCVRLPNGN